ncbi:MAG: thioredoxin family protein [Gemmatimonadetes bacterium]|nr:thioredoxin family protein [Gemmatimonadota bacterium]
MDTTETMSLRERFAAAPDFPGYLETVEKNRDLWHSVAKRATISDEDAERARAIPGSWKLLALTEDWCGDAVNTLPVVARLAERTPGLELRVLLRDENLDIMDAHLTNGKSRSIPIVVIYDEDFRERAWWGPRPTEIQNWVMEEGLDMDAEPRYKEVRRYYARDKGRSTVDELLSRIEGVANEP